MNSRDPFPDEELRRRIMDFIMAAGQTLLENGAEVFRVEQTMEIMARSFHLREFHVYVLTNGIFASAGTAEISEVRNVPVRTTHLGRVAAVNALSRQIAQTGMTLDEAESRLVLARRMPLPQGLACSCCPGMCRRVLLCADLRRQPAQCTGSCRGGTGGQLAICCGAGGTSCPAAFRRSAPPR
ncbi:MAG: threonine/serine exporter family protein [Faecalibacterium prausnitzii]